MDEIFRSTNGGIRTIKPAFFTSEDICRRQPLARILFEGLWCEADRDGCLADSPFQLKTRLLPNDDCDIDALLWELASGDVANPLIRRYTANGKNFIQILAFTEHQRPHPKEPKSTIPKDGTERKQPIAVNENGGPRQVAGCFPSSPVGREGDLESGDLGREGKGTAHRQPVQGPGAFGPGTLPRDHMRHGYCGPGYRLCLNQWEFTELAKQFGGSDPNVARIAIEAFVDELVTALGENQSPGGFKEIEKEFQVYLRKVGRLSQAPRLMDAPQHNDAHERFLKSLKDGTHGR